MKKPVQEGRSGRLGGRVAAKAVPKAVVTAAPKPAVKTVAKVAPKPAAGLYDDPSTPKHLAASGKVIEYLTNKLFK